MSEESNQTRTITKTVSIEEIDRFSKLADEWWDESGPFAPLHKINPLRMAFVKKYLCEYFPCDTESTHPLRNISILDVGCGGGLLCEPLARLGGRVTGIDAAERNVEVARIHAELSDLSIKYHHMSPEEAVTNNFRFDVVINMEVIEHVSDPDLFLRCITSLVKPGGVIIGSTINRTIKSLAFAKIGAEYVLRWLPRGTHDWRMFVQPSEFASLLRKNSFETTTLMGLSYNLLDDEWSLSDDLSINYLISATRQ